MRRLWLILNTSVPVGCLCGYVGTPWWGQLAAGTLCGLLVTEMTA